MKKILLSSLAIAGMLMISHAQSQLVYGLAQNGGGGTGGTIFKMNPDGTGYTVVHDFTSPDGWMPMGNLIHASDGNLYGCCHEGGDWASCTIFRYLPGSDTYEDVWDFDITNGDFPKSGVVEGPGGKLWGAAWSGGTSGIGVIYSYEISTDTYLAEHSFTNGHSPYACPILVGNEIFGTTTTDLNNNSGVIYRYNVTNDTYTEFHPFTTLEGKTPYGSLFLASDGKLYGMASEGGDFNYGVIYSFDMGTNTYTKVHDFNLTDGTYPHGGFVQGSGTKIYGMAMSGGANNAGTIFSFDVSNNNFQKVHNFDLTEGATPLGDLTYDATSGKFYGVTSQGGQATLGVMFSFNPTGNVFQKLYDFDSPTGSNPNGAVLFVDPTASVPTIEDVEVTLYPNPVTDRFTISISEPMEGNVLFEMMDINGKVILSWKETNVAGNYTKVIDMGRFANGAYVLEISNGNTKTSRKIVK